MIKMCVLFLNTQKGDSKYLLSIFFFLLNFLGKFVFNFPKLNKKGVKYWFSKYAIYTKIKVKKGLKRPYTKIDLILRKFMVFALFKELDFWQ